MVATITLITFEDDHTGSRILEGRLGGIRLDPCRGDGRRQSGWSAVLAHFRMLPTAHRPHKGPTASPRRFAAVTIPDFPRNMRALELLVEALESWQGLATEHHCGTS